MNKFIIGFVLLKQKENSEVVFNCRCIFVRVQLWHCRLFALSDCKDPAFYDDFKLSHDDCCNRCELLA